MAAAIARRPGEPLMRRMRRVASPVVTTGVRGRP